MNKTELFIAYAPDLQNYPNPWLAFNCNNMACLITADSSTLECFIGLSTFKIESNG